MGNKIKYNCIFGGGGIRGMCYIGAVKALKEFDIEINDIGGSSVGSVFAALYACGYNEDEIKDLFIDFNFNMFRDINMNIFNNDISLSKGEIFLDWLREKISYKILGRKDKETKIRFKDIKKNLYILTIDLNTNTPYIFSKESSPDEEIAMAVRASASLPGLMKPINKNNALLVDGDLIKSWPAWKIYNELNQQDTRLLEFRLEGSRDGSEIKNPIDYINSIVNTIWYLSTENVFNTFNTNDRYDYIVIDTKDVILFDFRIDREEKEKLIEKGYKATFDYLSKTLIEKRKKIIPVYRRITYNLAILAKLINGNKAEESLNKINEILSTMTEDTKYTDIYVYETVSNIKEELIKQIKLNFIFSKKIEGRKKITDKIICLESEITRRLQELNEYVTKYNNNC